MNNVVQIDVTKNIYVVMREWSSGHGDVHSYYNSESEAILAAAYLQEEEKNDGVLIFAIKAIPKGKINTKAITDRYYQNRYEDIRQYWKEIGVTELPPAWDELTEDQRQKVIEEEKRYQKEMQDFGEQLRKDHGQ